MVQFFDAVFAELPKLQEFWRSAVVITVAALAFGWVVGRFMYGQRIENLKGDLASADRRIAEYKDKLNGATPEEVKARIETLEAQIARLRPPSLSAEQINAARAVLAKATPAGVNLVVHTAGIDNSRIPAQLKAVFQEAKWPVMDGLLFEMSNPAPSGIALMMSPEHLEQSVVVKNVLDATGVPYSIYKHPEGQNKLPEICFTHAAS